MYVNEVSGGLSDPKAKPTVIKDSPSTAYVDGHNGIGSVSVHRIQWYLVKLSTQYKHYNRKCCTNQWDTCQ